MRINTITCHRVYNHGAALQAWALATFLKQQGHDVDIIDYRPDYLRGHFLWNVSNPRFDVPVVRWLYLMAKYPSWKKNLKRKAAFDAFDDKFIAPMVTDRTYLSTEELKETPPLADVYIAGSDQIWNTTFRNGTDPAFYLDFGRLETRRVSYAASFATDSIVDGKESFVRENLKRFDKISVRETSAIQILHKLGYKGIQVVDPVFLLPAKHWDTLIADYHDLDIYIKQDYVLVYDFMNDGSIRAVTKKCAKNLSAKIYSIGPTKLSYADKSFNYEGPLSFVQLIKHAKCVISNSFHGTAFSIIYHRPFWVVNRKDGLNTRMRDILSKYGIPERLISADADKTLLSYPIDYTQLDQRLEQDIMISQTFLNDL